MSKKRILYVHHGVGRGGAPLSLLYLILGLDKKLYEPHVIFLHDSEMMALYRRHGIPVYGPVNISDFAHTKIWWYKWYHPHHLFNAIKGLFVTALSTAPMYLKLINPDVVHLNTSSLIGWAYAARKRHVPVVWHVREPLAEGYFGMRKHFVRSMVGRYATKIVPISRADAVPWLENSKTSVVYNPVDITAFHPAADRSSFLTKYPISPDKNIILFLGGFSQEKGTELILRVMKGLSAQLSSAHLVIAGYFPLYEARRASGTSWFEYFRHISTREYRRKVYRLLDDLEGAVTLVGSLENVPAAMAAADVIVFPATVGHFARPIIEAGCMAKPVVASNIPPLDELVINGETGFLVSPHDQKGWELALKTLLVDRTQAARMGRAHYDFCISHFAQKHHVDQMTSIYQSLEG